MNSLLWTEDARTRRRADAQSSPDLAAIVARLAADLEPVLARPVFVPERKALLSRWGSLCRDCGAELGFDPWSPDAQRCPGCGRSWSTEHTQRWWISWYQLWLAERALHAAVLADLIDDARLAPRAADVLAAIVARYPAYPNADNVLGPSRPFFSTYLESVWVLHLAAAASQLAAAGTLPPDLARDLRERLFLPSAALIADFDEGRSNRQVWHAAALYALGSVLDDHPLRQAAAHGPSGLLAALDRGLQGDGLWYEGENYHWFALRGLAWGATMLRASGDIDLWTAHGTHGRKFQAAFRAPVLTALPDFTFPARRDSKFGVTLRQRRMAELWEGALTAGGVREVDGRTGGRADGPQDDATFYASLLAHVYDPVLPEPGDTSRDITDVERNEPPTGVRRGALGWKALLWAAPALPVVEPAAWRPGSTHLEATGLGILRRDEGRTYLSLDYGESGGGHGHPDRLNLTLVWDGVPWLLDFGTGSYVSSSLAWYRSSVAHNAPYLDGASQAPARGRCVAWEDRGDVGWMCAHLPEGTAFEGAALQRTVVLTPWYVLDVLQMGSSAGERTLALPWHGLGRVEVSPGGLTVTRPEGRLALHLAARQRFQVQLAEGYGPPAAGGEPAELRFAVAFAGGEEVTLAACLARPGEVLELECVDESFVVRLTGDRMHTHQATDDGWRVELERGDPVELGGLREPEPDGGTGGPEDGQGRVADGRSGGLADGLGGVPTTERMFSPLAGAPILSHRSAAARCLSVREPPALDGTLEGFRLDAPLAVDRADQFRRAEDPWAGPDGFAARAWLNHDDERLYVGVDVTAPRPLFRAADAADPELENENPDIHSDGLQLYVTTSFFYGWVIIPDPHDHATVRASPVKGSDAEAEMVEGAWSPTAVGYRVTLAINVSDALEGFGFELMVNRSAPGRERRAGQLVWSGANGQRLYLAGDRPLGGELPWVAVE